MPGRAGEESVAQGAQILRILGCVRFARLVFALPRTTLSQNVGVGHVTCRIKRVAVSAWLRKILSHGS